MKVRFRLLNPIPTKILADRSSTYLDRWQVAFVSSAYISYLENSKWIIGIVVFSLFWHSTAIGFSQDKGHWNTRASSDQ